MHRFLARDCGKLGHALVCCLFSILVYLPCSTNVSWKVSRLNQSTHRGILLEETMLQAVIKVRGVLSSRVHPAIPNSSTLQWYVQIGAEDCICKIRDILSCETLAGNIHLECGPVSTRQRRR